MSTRRRTPPTPPSGERVDYIDPFSGVPVRYGPRGGRHEVDISDAKTAQWARYYEQVGEYQRDQRNTVRAVGTRPNGQTIFETFPDHGPASRQQISREVRERQARHQPHATPRRSEADERIDYVDDRGNAMQTRDRGGWRGIEASPERIAQWLRDHGRGDEREVQQRHVREQRLGRVDPKEARIFDRPEAAPPEADPRAPRRRDPKEESVLAPRRRRTAEIEPVGLHRGVPIYDLRRDKTQDGTRDHATYRGDPVRVVTDLVHTSRAEYPAMRQQKADYLASLGFTLTTRANYQANPNHHRFST